MRRYTLIFIMTLVIALAAPVAAYAAELPPTGIEIPAAETSASADTTASRLANLADSIVAISVGGDRVGSGVIIAPNTVVTSLNVFGDKRLQANPPAIWYENEFVGFKLIATDENLKLALLHAVLPGAKPMKWGRGGQLRRDDDVIAVGMPESVRDIIKVPGKVKAPALAMMGPVLTTDIPIDPLLEGGALLTPDGKTAGIIVSQGFGLGSGSTTKLGVAVTAEAAKEMVDRLEESAAEERAAAAALIRTRWLARGGLVAFLFGMFMFFRWFGRWYRRMEAREAAEEAAAASGATKGFVPTPAEDNADSV